MGVLGDIGQQLAHSLEDKAPNIVVERLGLSIALEAGQDAMPDLDSLGKPFHRRLKPDLLEDGRAELEGQRPRFTNYPLEKLVNFCQGFGKLGGGRRFAQRS